MRHKPLPTPLELRKMPLDKRTTPLVKLMFWKVIDDPMVEGKGLSRAYWRIYKFLQKQQEITINLLYDYLYTIVVDASSPKTPMDMTQIFHKANEWNIEQHMKSSDNLKPIEEYKDFLSILKEW